MKKYYFTYPCPQEVLEDPEAQGAQPVPFFLAAPRHRCTLLRHFPRNLKSNRKQPPYISLNFAVEQSLAKQEQWLIQNKNKSNLLTTQTKFAGLTLLISTKCPNSPERRSLDSKGLPLEPEYLPPGGPGSPGGPGGPGSPRKPGGPICPVSPLKPLGPMGPIGPWAPAGPIDPLKPGIPSAPWDQWKLNIDTLLIVSFQIIIIISFKSSINLETFNKMKF